MNTSEFIRTVLFLPGLAPENIFLRRSTHQSTPISKIGATFVTNGGPAHYLGLHVLHNFHSKQEKYHHHHHRLRSVASRWPNGLDSRLHI